MAKFNTKSSGSKTINRAGGVAYSQTAELELVSLLLTSFVNDKYYESASGQLKRLEGLAGKIKDKKFLGQAAIYARTQFGMRSITHALIGELVNKVKGQPWTKSAVEKTIHRVDDALEMVAYYGNNYGKPIPNALKKGIRNAIPKFDAYQLAKYKGSGKDVKLVDLFNLVHPKPTGELADIYAKLMAGELVSKGTWEAEISKAGQVKAETKEEREVIVAEKKKEAWKGLVKERKIGYFALLRNLRNILNDAPELIDDATAMLTDEKLIKKSLVLPFRYLTAIDEIEKISGKDSRKIITALNKAVDISTANVPEFDGETLVVLDKSGSMGGKPLEIGSLMAGILAKASNADVMLFHDRAWYKSVNPADSTLTITKQLRDDNDWGGTDFNVIFKKINRKYDRIVILSDMQGWMGDSWGYGGAPTKSFAKYKKDYGANPHLFAFDLQGYGDMMFPEEQVYEIAGFSDKVFDLMKLLEQDRKAMVNEIKKVEL
jgi:hypothetical protein